MAPVWWYIYRNWISYIKFILIITIIGIPFGIQTLKLAGLALWPFGKEAVYVENPPGCFSTVMNVLWIIIGGIWISLSHVLFGVLLGITIIGIPFAKQHFKLAGLALTPFGREIRSTWGLLFIIVFNDSFVNT